MYAGRTAAWREKGVGDYYLCKTKVFGNGRGGCGRGRVIKMGEGDREERERGMG